MGLGRVPALRSSIRGVLCSKGGSGTPLPGLQWSQGKQSLAPSESLKPNHPIWNGWDPHWAAHWKDQHLPLGTLKGPLITSKPVLSRQGQVKSIRPSAKQKEGRAQERREGRKRKEERGGGNLMGKRTREKLGAKARA